MRRALPLLRWEVNTYAQFGVPELLIILGIVVLIFGVGKLPAVGEALGKSIGGF